MLIRIAHCVVSITFAFVYNDNDTDSRAKCLASLHDVM